MTSSAKALTQRWGAKARTFAHGKVCIGCFAGHVQRGGGSSADERHELSELHYTEIRGTIAYNHYRLAPAPRLTTPIAAAKN